MRNIVMTLIVAGVLVGIIGNVDDAAIPAAQTRPLPRRARTKASKGLRCARKRATKRAARQAAKIEMREEGALRAPLVTEWEKFQRGEISDVQWYVREVRRRLIKEGRKEDAGTTGFLLSAGLNQVPPAKMVEDLRGFLGCFKTVAARAHVPSSSYNPSSQVVYHLWRFGAAVDGYSAEWSMAATLYEGGASRWSWSPKRWRECSVLASKLAKHYSIAETDEVMLDGLRVVGRQTRRTLLKLTGWAFRALIGPFENSGVSLPKRGQWLTKALQYVAVLQGNDALRTSLQEQRIPATEWLEHLSPFQVLEESGSDDPRWVIEGTNHILVALGHYQEDDRVVLLIKQEDCPAGSVGTVRLVSDTHAEVYWDRPAGPIEDLTWAPLGALGVVNEKIEVFEKGDHVRYVVSDLGDHHPSGTKFRHGWEIPVLGSRWVVEDIETIGPRQRMTVRGEDEYLHGSQDTPATRADVWDWQLRKL